MSLEIGKKFGEFLVKRRLGSGGMGEVFYAIDTMLNREVILKIASSNFIKMSNSYQSERSEAVTQAQVHHPNIVCIYSFGRIEDKYVLVMEYIDGKNLKEILSAKGHLSFKEAILYLKQILRALKYAHEHHIIHRDIKSSNILITRNGKVKLSDFGIAKISGLEQQSGNNTKTFLGSPCYVAPEQITGGEADTRSDLYSTGIVFFEMLTGRVPFEFDTDADIQMAHLKAPIPKLSIPTGAVPREIEEFILKVLEKKPERRFQSASEMLEKLDEILKHVS